MRILSSLLLFSCMFLFACKKEADSNQPTPEPLTSSTLNQGLMLYLPFDGNLADSSGAKLNATGFGSITYGSNRYFESNKSLYLNGTNNRLEIPADRFDTVTKFTFYMEFMPIGSASMTLFSRALFIPAAGNPRQAFKLMVNYGGGGTHFQMKKPGQCDNDNTNLAFGAPVLGQSLASINGWNYVAVSYNGTTIRTYLNGVLVGTSNQPNAVLCSNAPLMIGSWWQGDPYYFSGQIDEVRVYNRVLSSDEIAQLFQLHK